MSKGTSFKFDASLLEKGLLSLESKSAMAIKAYADTSALKLQNYARKNRPWKDRTAHARQRMTGSVRVMTSGYKLVLAHGVSYGKWLELAHNKKYSIIPQTIDKVGVQEIMPGFKNMMNKLKP